MPEERLDESDAVPVGGPEEPPVDETATIIEPQPQPQPPPPPVDPPKPQPAARIPLKPMRARVPALAAAAVGVVCGLLGIWVAALDYSGSSISYWDMDGTLGAYLLILAIVSALLLLGSLAAGGNRFDLALGAVAATMLGAYLFYPATLPFDFDQLDRLGAGAWLGVCTILAVLGAAAAHGLGASAPARAASRAPSQGLALAFVGLVLVLVSLWLKVDKGGNTYWSVNGASHSLGALFLVLIALCALGLGAGFATGNAAAELLGAGAGFVLLGLVLFGPVITAFNELGTLRVGAWLALVGGIAVAAGIVVSRRASSTA